VRRRFFCILLLAALLITGSITESYIVYAAEPAEEQSGESGRTFLDMIMEGPEEGSWEDVDELTPGMLGDGIYKLNAEIKSGTGDGSIGLPMTMNISGGAAKILISWDTERYEYLRLNKEEYLPLKKEAASVFEIKLDVLNQELELEVGGTDASGEVWYETYVLVLDLDSIEKEGMNPRIFGMIIGVVVGVVVMFVIIKLDKLHDKKKAAAQNTPAVKNTNKYRK